MCQKQRLNRTAGFHGSVDGPLDIPNQDIHFDDFFDSDVPVGVSAHFLGLPSFLASQSQIILHLRLLGFILRLFLRFTHAFGAASNNWRSGVAPNQEAVLVTFDLFWIQPTLSVTISVMTHHALSQ